jgi:hypothetical protein
MENLLLVSAVATSFTMALIFARLSLRIVLRAMRAHTEE